MHVVRREDDSRGDHASDSLDRKFTFVTCNTGQGLNYHASSGTAADGRPKGTARASLALAGVPGWRILDPSFLFMLLRLQVFTSAA